MKCALKRIISVLCLAALVITAGTAEAEEQKRKGFLVRLWERFILRRREPEKPAAAPVSQKPPEKPAEPGEPDGTVKVPLVSKARIIEGIEDAVRADPQVLEQIPGLSYKGSVDGRDRFYYRQPDSIPLKLRDHDRETLYKLLLRVKEAAAALRAQPAAPAGPAGPAGAEGAVPGVPAGPPAEAATGEVPEAPPAEKPAEEPEKGEKPEREIPYTKEEMIDVIKRRLKVYDQILYMVPNLSMKESADGEKEYYYGPRDGVARRLIELDKETLHDLFIRVNNEATRINTERLLRQIQQQEQVMRNIPKPPPQPVQPPQPPQTYIPPQPPPQPPQPVQPPPQPPANTGPQRR